MIFKNLTNYFKVLSSEVTRVKMQKKKKIQILQRNEKGLKSLVRANN